MLNSPNPTLTQIASVMGGEVSGNRAIFPTPGHSAKDRGSWASLVLGAPDGVLIHVSNDDERKALDIKDKLRAEGALPERDRSGGDSWRVTGTYEYADADGTILYRTVRKEKAGARKTFMAERVQGRGWASGLGDLERVLYRLPEIHAAINKAALTDSKFPTVYLVEGERKADKLASWGLIATAVAFGAQGWRKSYAEALAGCKVVILPDNDNPGRAFAEKAQRDIAKAGGKPLIVELPGLPPKGDIMDWAGTADDLRALVDKVINPPAKLLTLLDPGAWQGVETPAREWALADWIPHRQATYLTGPGSAGKSLLTQQICTCIALGLPFMGIDTRQAAAIYITCEDDADEMHRRQKAICEALRVPLSALTGKLHLVSLVGAIGNELATFTPEGRMTVAETYRTVQATAVATGAAFIALDNVAHLFAGNENIRNQVAAFCGLLNQLAHDIDGSVLFLGHPNKAGDSFSGSTAWENQVRSRLFLETPKSDDGTFDPDVRELSRGKANYARNGEAMRFRWHKWAFIREDDLPKDQRDEMAVVARANVENERFMECLAKLTDEHRNVSHSRSAGNYAPKVMASMPSAGGMKVKQFEGALNRLLHLQTVLAAQPLWKGADRKPVLGLAINPDGNGVRDGAGWSDVKPQNSAREQFAETCGIVRDGIAENGEKPCGTVGERGCSSITYLEGAPHGEAAPSHKEGAGLNLADFVDEGLDANGDVIGWND